MYESFYHLRERPFALTPDPDYLYPSRVHQEALSYLRYGVESHAGFVVITGEIGSGKTTLLQALVNGLDSETTVARLVNTMLEPHELLEAIMFDLGLEPTGLSKPAMLRALAKFLVSERQAKRLVLLIIDEAQNLGLPALEEIRMLSNLETEKSKLLQVVLVGQPNLRDKLLRPELEQLRQRITVSYHLEALDGPETAAYINHRLRRAAIGEPIVFPRDVTDRIYLRSRGLPRLVNVICDATLVFGYAEERRTIDIPLIDEVLEELQETGVLPREGRSPGARATEPVQPVMTDVAQPARPLTADVMARARPVTKEPAEALRPAAVERVTHAPVDLADLMVAERARVDAAAGAHRAADREQRLRAREQQMAERERELNEQKRVLAEECRLLRERFARGGAVAAEEAPAWPPVARDAYRAGETAAGRPRVTYEDDRAFETERAPTGFWRRMRILLGAGPIEG